MSLAQQVLLRVIILRCRENPISGPLTRWSTTLHDCFMLPAFLWEDFLDVIADLRDHDLRGHDLRGHDLHLDPQWFEAQAEFRFPFCDEVTCEGMILELRQALEPWQVMGETGAIGGTVRYTDSSVERLQVRLTVPAPTATASPPTGGWRRCRAPARTRTALAVGAGLVRQRARLDRIRPEQCDAGRRRSYRCGIRARSCRRQSDHRPPARIRSAAENTIGGCAACGLIIGVQAAATAPHGSGLGSVRPTVLQSWVWRLSKGPHAGRRTTRRTARCPLRNARFRFGGRTPDARLWAPARSRSARSGSGRSGSGRSGSGRSGSGRSGSGRSGPGRSGPRV